LGGFGWSRWVSGVTPLTIHGVDGLEGDDLGDPGGAAPQKFIQVVGVVVAEDVLGDPAAPDALDHGGVVPLVREDLATYGWGGHPGVGVGHPNIRVAPPPPPRTPKERTGRSREILGGSRGV